MFPILKSIPTRHVDSTPRSTACPRCRNYVLQMANTTTPRITWQLLPKPRSCSCLPPKRRSLRAYAYPRFARAKHTLVPIQLYDINLGMHIPAPLWITNMPGALHCRDITVPCFPGAPTSVSCRVYYINDDDVNALDESQVNLAVRDAHGASFGVVTSPASGDRNSSQMCW